LIVKISSSQVYDFCTNTKGQPTASKVSTKPAPKTSGNNRQTSVQDGANIVGGELYTKLKNHLKSYLEKICEVRSLVQEIFIKKDIRNSNNHCETDTLNHIFVLDKYSSCHIRTL
jgi:hypothetical protein